MAIRFRKRIKLAPGLHLNASGSGLGLSAGVRGASVSFGSRGTYLNSGIPGTGFSSRSKIGGGSSRGASQKQRRDTARVAEAERQLADLRYLSANPPKICVDGKEGPVVLRTESGEALAPHLEALYWKHCRADIASAMTRELESRRERIDQLGALHFLTPPPSPRPAYRPEAFAEPEPVREPTRPHHWFLGLFRSHRERIDRLNEEAGSRYSTAVEDRDKRKADHATREAGKARMYQIRDTGSAAAIEGFLSWHFGSLNWPQETSVNFDLSGDTRTLFLDIDLPEIEDFPDGYQQLLAKGDEVRWKKLTDSARRQLYMNHVHGVGLRLAGEVFAHCPTVEQVQVSAYSQRPDRKTGAVEDQYLYSSRIIREAWRGIDFAQLSALDPVAAFDRFDTRRQMTKTGVFKPIEPFAADDAT